MRAMVPTDRAPPPLSALDTVPGDTPASRATSLIVAGFLLAGFLPGGIALASCPPWRPGRSRSLDRPGARLRGRSDRLSIGEEKVVCEVSFSYSAQRHDLVKSPAKP